MNVTQVKDIVLVIGAAAGLAAGASKLYTNITDVPVLKKRIARTERKVDFLVTGMEIMTKGKIKYEPNKVHAEDPEDN